MGMVRGQIRPGYDLQFKLQFDVAMDDEKQCVTVTGEINDTDDADDFISALEFSACGSAYQSAVKELLPSLFANFQDLKTAMVSLLDSEGDVRCTPALLTFLLHYLFVREILMTGVCTT